jgi:hypothetical protein
MTSEWWLSVLPVIYLHHQAEVNDMEIIQGKDSFNEMATGILVKLFADYPSYSNFDYSDFAGTRTPNRVS